MRTIMSVVCACVVVVAAQAMGAPPVRAVYEPSPEWGSTTGQAQPRETSRPIATSTKKHKDHEDKAPARQAKKPVESPKTSRSPEAVKAPEAAKASEPTPGPKGSLTGVINVNTASAETLTLLPGIGPKMAERIVARRQRRPFRTPRELRRVRGIGEKKYNKLSRFVVTQGETTLRKW